MAPTSSASRTRRRHRHPGVANTLPSPSSPSSPSSTSPLSSSSSSPSLSSSSSSSSSLSSSSSPQHECQNRSRLWAVVPCHWASRPAVWWFSIPFHNFCVPAAAGTDVVGPPDTARTAAAAGKNQAAQRDIQHRLSPAAAEVAPALLSRARKNRLRARTYPAPMARLWRGRSPVIAPTARSKAHQRRRQQCRHQQQSSRPSARRDEPKTKMPHEVRPFSITQAPPGLRVVRAVPTGAGGTGGRAMAARPGVFLHCPDAMA